MNKRESSDHKRRIQSAGLVLAVFDYSEALNEDDRLIIEAVKASGVPALAIVNKTDLNQKIDEQYIRNNFKQIVYTNSEDVTSLERVTDAVESLLQLHQVDLSDGMIANERQRLCALEAQAALKEALDTMLSGMTLDAVNVMIDQAIDALLQLTGEKATEKIVDQVFHHFCVGK